MNAAKGASRVTDLKPLTSLRFVAAIMIVAYHAKNYFLWSWVHDAPSTLSKGVSFFFVLSGFILTHVYTSKPINSYRYFIRARVARLWPIHVATLIILVTTVRPDSITFDGPGIFNKWIALSINLALLHSIVPFFSYTFSWNAVSWSISTEIFFYLAFPLLLMQIEKTWHWKLLGAALSCAALLTVLKLAHVPLDGDVNTLSVQSATYANPLARGFEFCLGMAAWVFWRRYVRALNLRAVAWTIIEATLLIITTLWLSSWFFTIEAFLKPDELLQQLFRLSSSSGFFAALIVGFASGRGLIGRILSARIPVFLGHISFAIYMVHQVLMKAAITWLPSTAVHTLPYIAILLIVAASLHLLVEKPLQTWIAGSKQSRKDGRRLRPAD